MDRHEAYKLLAATLERYRQRPFAELRELVGRRSSERVRTETGDEFLLEISVQTVERRGDQLRVSASADSPGLYLERIEESILITRSNA